jgi:hypothetical protein
MQLLRLFFALVLLPGSILAQGSGFQILSLGANGRLTWTNAYPNGLYGVEWAPSLTGPWKDNWTALKTMVATGQTVAVDVPMFYRVKCDTNLFLPMPMGAYLGMSVSNAIGMVSTERMTVAGSVFLPSKDKEFTVLDGTSSLYPGASRTLLMRSTSNAAYAIDADCGMEELGMTNAPIGTSWTNTVCGEVTVNTIEANEQVTVPLGTFTCLRVRKQRLNTSHPNPVWIEWWQPGFGQVQWIDYFVDSSEYPPVVHRLTARGLAQ